MSIYCQACGTAIPWERLQAVPGACHCVKCQGRRDVPVVGRMVYGHKTGGELEILSPQAATKMRDAEAAIAERVSRL